jgi:hypothetical protein
MDGMVGDSFAEWRDRQPSGLRPYEVGDEIAKWRLRLIPRDLEHVIVVRTLDE